MPGNTNFRQIADSAQHFAIVSADLDGIITYANPGAARILGWVVDELVGRPISCIFTAEDRLAGVPECEMAAARSDGYGSDERWHLRRDGQRFWAVGEVTPLKDEAGQLSGYVKMLQDRTDTKRHELGLAARTGLLERRLATRTRERDRLWANSLDLLLEIDPQGVARAINPAWQPTLGYEPADLVGHHFAPFVHPEDVERTALAIELASQGPLVHFEVRIRHQDGSYHDIVWTAAPSEGMIYANGRDITREKRQAELLAAQAQARLRIALEAGRMGAWEWDMKSGQVLLLEGAAALHGLPDDAPSIGFPTMAEYGRLVHPDDLPRLQAAMRAAMTSGGAQRVEYRVQPPGGALRWLEVRGVVLRDEHGKPSLMPGVSIDITARKQAEQDRQFLEQASGQLAALVDVQSTIDRVVRLAVPGFADWCAIDLVQNGQLVRLAVAHVDPHKVALAHELHRRFPPKLDDPGGSWRIVHSGQPVLVPVIDQERVRATIAEPERRDILLDLGLRSYIGVPLISHGEVIGVGTFISAESGRTYTPQDLALATEFARRAAIAIDNARLYQAVQQADRDKDVFLATLSHELRNPLSALANAVALMGMQPQQQQQQARQMAVVQQVMQRQVGQLSRLVDDLLDISRIATGKIALRRGPVDLVTVLQHAVEATRPLVEARRHRLDVRWPQEPVEVTGDAARLTQILTNLLGNAAKFTPEGGRIEVELRLRAGECALHVRDSGIGIEAAMLPRLFELFAQGRQVDGAAAGLGIGLSLAERLVQLHGGRISAHSDGPGQGSEFVVQLPLALRPADAVPDAAASGAPAAQGGWWRGRRVLVVDDNVDAAVTLGALLQGFGATVQVVHDGAAALEAVRAGAPEAVLLDIGMPVMDGLEVARRIRADGMARRIRLIALTGWGQVHDREAALAAGFDHHWVKPVALAQLRGFSG